MKKLTILLLSVLLISCTNKKMPIYEGLIDNQTEIQDEVDTEIDVIEEDKNIKNSKNVVSCDELSSDQEESSQCRQTENIEELDEIILEDEIPCETSITTYKVDGDSMSPLLENEQELEVIKNYYACGGKINRGDIIILNNSATGFKDYIKEIKVLPGDKVIFNEEGNMILNDKKLVNSAGEIYTFSEVNIQMMNLYLVDGYLFEDAYFVFGDNLNSSIDSRTFGGISDEGFMGKVKN